MNDSIFDLPIVGRKISFGDVFMIPDKVGSKCHPWIVISKENKTSVTLCQMSTSFVQMFPLVGFDAENHLMVTFCNTGFAATFSVPRTQMFQYLWTCNQEVTEAIQKLYFAAISGETVQWLDEYLERFKDKYAQYYPPARLKPAEPVVATTAETQDNFVVKVNDKYIPASEYQAPDTRRRPVIKGDITDYCRRICGKEISVIDVANELGCSKATVYYHLAQYKRSQKSSSVEEDTEDKEYKAKLAALLNTPITSDAAVCAMTTDEKVSEIEKLGFGAEIFKKLQKNSVKNIYEFTYVMQMFMAPATAKYYKLKASAAQDIYNDILCNAVEVFSL